MPDLPCELERRSTDTARICSTRAQLGTFSPLRSSGSRLMWLGN